MAMIGSRNPCLQNNTRQNNNNEGKVGYTANQLQRCSASGCRPQRRFFGCGREVKQKTGQHKKQCWVGNIQEAKKAGRKEWMA
jgi:hypothetical protein